MYSTVDAKQTGFLGQFLENMYSVYTGKMYGLALNMVLQYPGFACSSYTP
jgi:hypothetical protein